MNDSWYLSRLLEIVITSGIPTEEWRIVTLRTSKDAKRAFHVRSYNKPVTPGRYLCIASDRITDGQFGDIEELAYDCIITGRRDMAHEGGPVMYLIFPIEEFPKHNANGRS